MTLGVEKGRVSIPLNRVFHQAAIEAEGEDTPWHPRGGWTRTVTGLNKNYESDQSIVGDPVKHAGLCSYQQPGLYLDASFSGSMKHLVIDYRLLRLNVDGTAEMLQRVEGCQGWARQFWPLLERLIQQRSAQARDAKFQARAGGPQERLLRLLDRRGKLIVELDAIRQQIREAYAETGIDPEGECDS